MTCLFSAVPSGKPDDISLLPLHSERGPLWIDPTFERGWRGEFQKDPETKLLNCDVKPMVSADYRSNMAAAEYAELDQRNLSSFYGTGGYRGDQVSTLANHRPNCHCLMYGLHEEINTYRSTCFLLCYLHAID